LPEIYSPPVMLSAAPAGRGEVEACVQCLNTAHGTPLPAFKIITSPFPILLFYCSTVLLFKNGRILMCTIFMNPIFL
jgi:hypothetical protein